MLTDQVYHTSSKMERYLVQNGTRLAILWVAASSNRTCGLRILKVAPKVIIERSSRRLEGSLDRAYKTAPFHGVRLAVESNFLMRQIGVSCGQWRLPILRHVSLQNLKPHFTISVVCAHTDYPLEEAK